MPPANKPITATAKPKAATATVKPKAATATATAKEENINYPELNILNMLNTPDINISCSTSKDYNYNKRAIFVCVDNNCINGLFMLIYSISKHNDMNNYVFNILTEKDSYIPVLNLMYIFFNGLNYNIKKFDVDNIDKISKYFNSSCTNNSHCKNIMNYSRFFYEKYFNEDYYLYIDTDIMVQYNLDVFFSNLENEYIKAVLSDSLSILCVPVDNKRKYLENKYNISFSNLGFNAGMYSINNKKGKEENHLGQIIDFMNKEAGSFKFGTQPIVNFFYRNIRVGIPDEYIYMYKQKCYLWNYYNTFMDIGKIIIKTHKKCFKSIHFVGNIKPWDYECAYNYIYTDLIIDLVSSLK